MVKISEDLAFRGLVHQVSDESLWTLLDNGTTTAYAGFDPSSDSLHVGHLLGIFTLRRLQVAGHRPILLAGGGTGLIGDPGGKSEERPLFVQRGLAANLEGIRAQLGRLLDLSPGRRSGPGTAARQLRMALCLRVHRLSSRRRQVLHRQPDGRQGVRQGAPRAARPGHLLHRIQLHAPAGLRLPPPARQLRVPTAARRQRPVGQHHDGSRAHKKDQGSRGVRAHLAPAGALGRHQVRQDRVRGRLLGPGQDLSL